MENKFSIILTLITLACGIIWLIDAIFFAPKRKERVREVLEKNPNATNLNSLLKESLLVENARSFFPILAAVVIFRTFIFEPFQIPSGSMEPTLLVGDFILVQKFSYGLKDPIWRTQLLNTNKPKRGDIVVFKYPKNPNLDYIKRVVGLPGDTIVYKDKNVYIKPSCTKEPCPPLTLVSRTQDNYEFSEKGTELTPFTEQLGSVKHDILINKFRQEPIPYYFRQPGLDVGEFVVPAKSYFVMGDNRDNSEDSRFWGFVPEENLVGKAVFIWVSFIFSDDPSSALPSWVPRGIRFHRIGTLK